eukprot:jgi/Chrzof1/8994/Cz03g32070.t1
MVIRAEVIEAIQDIAQNSQFNSVRPTSDGQGTAYEAVLTDADRKRESFQALEMLYLKRFSFRNYDEALDAVDRHYHKYAIFDNNFIHTYVTDNAVAIWRYLAFWFDRITVDITEAKAAYIVGGPGKGDSAHLTFTSVQKWYIRGTQIFDVMVTSTLTFDMNGRVRHHRDHVERYLTVPYPVRFVLGFYTPLSTSILDSFDGLPPIVRWLVPF